MSKKKEESAVVSRPRHVGAAGNTPEITEDLIRSLPKAELHCHLDGSLRPQTILELAEERKITLPSHDLDGIRKHVIPPPECKSLVEYLSAFDITLSVMQDAEALYRVAYELVEDCAGENIRYLEVRYSPILHTRTGMRLTSVVEAVNEGLAAGEKDFGVRTGVIICGMRNINPQTSYSLAELAIAYKNKGVVAFDLAGAEEDFPAKKHKEAFFLILRNNINCTLHAGESYGPESIHQAIHYCGAHRIGHGTRLIEDGDLLNYVNDHRIPLEICLTSNVQTKAARSIKEHPLRLYYDFGLRTTICTDNRLMSDTSVSRELYLAHKELDFTLPEIADLIIYGFKSAFLPYRIKAKMLREVASELVSKGIIPKTQITSSSADSEAL
jgi:adenosine deaminase